MEMLTLGDISQLVGAIGVVASLLYLAMQVKQAQRVARAENVRAAQAAYSRVFQMLAEDAELAEIYHIGSQDPSRLNQIQLSRFSNVLLLQFLGFVEIHTTHANGLIDTELYERWKAALAGSLQTPGGKKWWSVARASFKSDVVRVLDQLEDQVRTTDEILDELGNEAEK